LTVQIQPLHGVGAEILGVDLDRELSNPEFDAVRAAYAEYGVIFFRDQTIDEDQHIAFARRWAPININRFLATHPDHPEIALVSKEREQRENIGGAWHTDHSYDQIPAMGSILVARELPPEGGNTLFASMYGAFNALSEERQRQLSTLNAVHSARHIFAKGAYYGNTDAGGSRIGNAEAAEHLVDAIHPVVIEHPLSGKHALYVNPAYTIRIEGWPEHESRALLMELFAHCIQGEFVHEFVWRPGSIAFWDNRATWHFAKNDYHGHRREMHRITVEGEPLRGAPACGELAAMGDH